VKRIRKALAERGESQADIDNIILDIHDFAAHWDWDKEPFLAMAEMASDLFIEFDKLEYVNLVELKAVA